MKKRNRNLNRKINNAVKRELDSLLFPTVQIVTPFAVPQQADPGSAGYDIQADLFGLQEKFLDNAQIVRKEGGEIEFLLLHPGGQFLCPTGIHTSFDVFHSADIQPRSGLALKKRITITNSPGLIDSTYKNEWGIILANEGHEDLIIKQGDPIAQVVFRIVCHPRFVQVDSVDELTGTDRGGGFGHSSEQLFKK